jgi:Glycoside Hydrolase Family 113
MKLVKSAKFWTVILLSLIHFSFLPDISDFLYNRKSFPEKIDLVKKKFQTGIVLPLFALEGDYDYYQALDEIASIGARSVSFFVTNYQEDIRSNTIYLNRRASEPRRLANIIDYAHSRGLSVFLFPTLHIQHLGDKEWRGVLKPKNPQEWWNSYFRVIRYYLGIARLNRVELFSIGSELCANEQDDEQWAKMIRYCRSKYDGLLTYSANWDHYHDIRFVRDLDFFGMNAYFGLTNKDDPTLSELLQAWKPAKKRIEQAAKEYNKPILFTEIGYPSVDGTNAKPWNYFATSKTDVEEQALCYRAFIETWDPPPNYLHGVYFYNWWGRGGIGDRDYTPRDKPAEDLLRTWYSSLR